LGGHNLEHSKSIYFKILLTLFVLTLVTVGVSYIDFGSVALAIAVGLLIASVKGFLVAGNFMHLFDEVKTIYWILILSVLFFIPLFFIPLLWDNDLIKETKVGAWVGQSEQVEKAESEEDNSHGH
tara:strand:- start:876 stop:1250 length:375 start_codon:yes stop_codon:yes gene_type:complete